MLKQVQHDELPIRTSILSKICRRKVDGSRFPPSLSTRLRDGRAAKGMRLKMTKADHFHMPAAGFAGAAPRVHQMITMTGFIITRMRGDTG